MFLTWTGNESGKHQTDAEVEDAVTVCKDSILTFKTNIASLDVDNAARGVAGKVAKKFAQEGKVILFIRNPSHCVDL